MPQASTSCYGTISKTEEIEVVLYHTHLFCSTLPICNTPFLNGVTLWHHQMPYYAMLIERKTEGLMDCVWGFINGTIRQMARPL